MEVRLLMPIVRKYEKCPKCGSGMIGNGEGGIIVEDDTFTRTCKCGFKITVDKNGREKGVSIENSGTEKRKVE